MEGASGGRTLRLGSLIIIGAALLAAAAIGLQWPSAPAFLFNPLTVVLLVFAGALLVTIPLTVLLRSRRVVRAVTDPTDGRSTPSADPSLLTLPSLLREAPREEVPMGLPDPSEPYPVPPSSPVLDLPIGVSRAESGRSTLLIPLSVEPTPPAAGPPTVEPVRTVTRLVDRMDALQRATATLGTPAPSSAPTAQTPATPNLLLHRLGQVPSPPVTTVQSWAGRRCSDCGDTLGSPPRFDSCADCGRALCARCYWRTSSGPQAHLCTTCFRDRSVPRPPAPMATIPRPAEFVSPPAGRRGPPRRSPN